MKRNIDRVSQLIGTVLEAAQFVRSCFNWESPLRSITAFAVSTTDDKRGAVVEWLEQLGYCADSRRKA